MDVQNEVAGSSLAIVAILGPCVGNRWVDRQTVRRKDLWSPNMTKISQMNRQPNFLIAMWLGLRTWSFTNSVLQTLISGQIS